VLLLLALSLASAASSPVTLEHALRNTTPTFGAPMQDDGRQQYDNPCFAGKFSILKSPLYYYSFCIFTSCMIVFFLELAGFDPNSCVKLSSYCGRRIAEWWLAWQRQLFSPASTMHWCCPLLLAFLV
jgi:hypothetical protein